MTSHYSSKVINVFNWTTIPGITHLLQALPVVSEVSIYLEGSANTCASHAGLSVVRAICRRRQLGGVVVEHHQIWDDHQWVICFRIFTCANARQWESVGRSIGNVLVFIHTAHILSIDLLDLLIKVQIVLKIISTYSPRIKYLKKILAQSGAYPLQFLSSCFIIRENKLEGEENREHLERD